MNCFAPVRVAAAVIFSVMAASVFALPSSYDDEGKVDFKWDTDIHDFGAFNEDVGSVSCTFKGINIGQDTASVVHLSASCGCTQPKVDKKIIAPGDSVTITVVYDPSNRPGIFDKRITFGTVPNYRAVFHIKGSVISSTRRLLATYPHEVGPYYRLSDSSVSFGNIREDRTVSATIRGVNNTMNDVTPVVTRTPGYVSAIVEPPIVKPGGKFVISLSADGPKVGQLGVSLDTLSVSEAGHPEISMDIPVSILLFEEFPEMTADDVDRAAYLVIPDPKVDFGTGIDPRSKKAIKRKVTVTNEGLEPLLIRRAYTITKGITVKAPTKAIEPGKSADLEISLIPASFPADVKEISARISVISNTPLNTTMDITATGSFK